MNDAIDPLPLSRDDELTLARVLDEIIPPSPDGRFPGAGEIGLVAAVVAAAGQNPALGSTVLAGLAALDDLARGAHGCAFRELRGDERTALFAAFAAREDAFVPALTFPIYVAYYQHPRVMEALGREPRPPYPLGYELAPFDEALLEPVRRLPKLYREV